MWLQKRLMAWFAVVCHRSVAESREVKVEAVAESRQELVQADQAVVAKSRKQGENIG